MKVTEIQEGIIATVFLQFNLTIPERPRKTEIWEIYNRRNLKLLGVISWSGRWRQYVFHPEADTMFNTTCLKEIAWFCSQRNSVHLQQIRKGRQA